MKTIKFYSILKFSIFLILQNFLVQNLVASEPIVVLEYSSNKTTEKYGEIRRRK